MKVAWKDRTEAGLELESGERLVAFREVSFDGRGRRKTRWTAQWVNLRNMSDIRTTSARSVEELARKLGREKNLRPTSIRSR